MWLSIIIIIIWSLNTLAIRKDSNEFIKLKKIKCLGHNLEQKFFLMLILQKLI